MAEEPTAPETPENPEAAEAASAPEMEAAEAPMPMPVPEEDTGADAGNEGGQTVASGKMPTPEGSGEAPAPAAGGEAATGGEGEGAEEAEAPTDKSGLIVAIIAPVVLIPLCYFLVKPLVTQQVAHASATFLAVKTNYLAKKAELDAGRQHAAEIAKGHAWGYTTTNGPVRWAELGYPLAYRGQRQSPIDIREAQVIDASGLPPLQFDYHDGPLDMAHTGHTIQITPKTASSIIIDGRVYRLAQFHFHTPSEHFYNGQPYPMEVHLVHVLDENATGNILPAGDLGNAGPGAAPDKPFADKTKKTTASKQLAVIGIFIREGAAPHPYATKLINAMPTSPMAQRTLVGQGLNPAQLLPANHSYYRYHGSLTTPPLTENVLWTVLSKPIEFSIEQIEVFKKLFPTDKKNLGNARPPQPLGRRFVVHHRAPATTNTPPAPTPTDSPPAVTIKPPLPTLTNAPPVATNTPPVPIPTNTPPAATNIPP
ncbi:MAG: carbonic anhydrase family protein, partial [Verrucomicrobiota bacterium]|nr:carbonic anhydrase family protein [Verrucomicrobiota bacterium]